MDTLQASWQQRLGSLNLTPAASPPQVPFLHVHATLQLMHYWQMLWHTARLLLTRMTWFLGDLHAYCCLPVMCMMHA